MTRVRIAYLADGFIFDCSGHAGYAEKGRDIVCAGVSSLCMGLAGRISELAEENIVSVKYFHCAEGDVYIEVTFGDEEFCRIKALEALETVRCGLEGIESHYPEYLLVE